MIAHLLRIFPNHHVSTSLSYISSYIFNQWSFITFTTTLIQTKPKMKAARYYGPGIVKLDQVPEPQAKEGQVKIKVCIPLHSICWIFVIDTGSRLPGILSMSPQVWKISHSMLSLLLLLGTEVGGLILKKFTNLLFLNSLWEWFTSVSSGRTLFPDRYYPKPIDRRNPSCYPWPRVDLLYLL